MKFRAACEFYSLYEVYATHAYFKMEESRSVMG